jgi:hypothetical protein
MSANNPRHGPSPGIAASVALVLLSFVASAFAQDMKIAKPDLQVDALDPGIKLFLREKMTEGNNTFTDDNVEKKRFEFFEQVLTFLRD